MQRRLACISLLAVLAWPALAQAAPNVNDLVAQAVHALQTQCYEARMRFLSPMDGGTEQVVRAFHVAPDLYRVEPLINGEPGPLAYIENAVELVRLRVGQRVVEQMPQRQFSLNDALTVTFLRMLVERGGTTVLSGMVGSYEVYVLRQDSAQKAPYTITVAVDKQTYFPVFLNVSNKNGRLVYYEMEAIEYLKPHQLRDALFTVPSPQVQQKLPAPRAPSPNQADKAGSRIPGGRDLDLPPYPQWLPKGFFVEAVSVLNYKPGAAPAPAVVFQFEAYGPKNDLISIFLTRSEDVDLKVDAECNEPGGGCHYAMLEKDGWVVTVIGDQAQNLLLRIADELGQNKQRVIELLRQTRERDRILQQFAGE